VQIPGVASAIRRLPMACSVVFMPETLGPGSLQSRQARVGYRVVVRSRWG
jgi:hypothetical protein